VIWKPLRADMRVQRALYTPCTHPAHSMNKFPGETLDCSRRPWICPDFGVGTAVAEYRGQENIMKNFISISVVFVASSLVFGCAGTGVTRSGPASATRGSVVTHGQSVKAIVQGPTVIHAFAANSGGALFTVPFVTGSDSDCGTISSGGTHRPAAIPPDQRVVLTVEPGQIACLVTAKARTFELLWHAHGEAGVEGHQTQIALAARGERAK
jgi:hypothetical protein